jgi:alpha-beta hydrolase superfamily lysophospholipase
LRLKHQKLSRFPVSAGTCYLGDPAAANDAPTSLGRLSTLRNWLSQWSVDDSNASAEKFGKDDTLPALILTSGADNGCPPSHADRIVAALGGETTRHDVAGASHYYIGQPQQLAEAVTVALDWLGDRLGQPVGTS